MIMTVDIGGTKTMWSLWGSDVSGEREGEKSEISPVETGAQPTISIDDFVHFLEKRMAGRNISALSFAMAGPVKDRRLELTNTGQIIDLQRIKDRFANIPDIVFLNDLEALAWSVSCLKGEQIRIFREAPGKMERGKKDAYVPEDGAKAILSIGTGLGIAAVTREGVVLPSEGGHVDFAPRNQRQHKLLSRLEEKYGGHVSYERLLSGHGLANIYETVSGNAPDSPAEVSKRAAAGEATALESFEIFTEILGAACGNFALTFMASGGVYLGGGMIPKILPFIDGEIFEKAFTDKGRFARYLNGLSVYAIMDERAPSLGAAAACARHRSVSDASALSF